MQLNLDMMQIIVRQVPVLIIVLTVIVQLVAVSQRRSRLLLKRSDHSRYRSRLDRG